MLLGTQLMPFIPANLHSVVQGVLVQGLIVLVPKADQRGADFLVVGGRKSFKFSHQF